MEKYFELIPPDLHGSIEPAAVAKIFNDLETLPLSINSIGLDLDAIDKKIMEVQKSINTANKNLEAAESTCIAFPDRELKNDAQRKAYIREKTGVEQIIILELQNKKISLESEKMDIEREYRKLNDIFAAVKIRANLANGLLNYLNGLL